jgi:Tol biopolymer transport system component
MPVSRLFHGVLAIALIAFAGCGSDSPGAQKSKPNVAPKAAALPGRVLFSKEVAGTYQLFTIAPDGSGQRQLTQGAGAAVEADWSPDGRLIAFEYDRPNDNGCELRLVNADGSALKALSGPKQPCDMQPSFTPDGRRIVFVRYDDKADKETIRSMDLKGGDVRLVGGHLGDTDPNVSPDGKTVTFMRSRKDHELQALFAIGIDGSRLRRLTPYKDEIARKHAWSPDGRRIAVTDNADWVRPEASANILTFRPDGSGRKHLTHYKGGQVRGLNAFTGSYSPDGRHIVLRVERNDRGGLAIMDDDGRNLHMITPRAADRPRFIDWGRWTERNAP